MRSFAGDWFLDTEANINWFGLLGQRGVATRTIRREIERVILNTEGIVRIDSITVDFDRATRKAIYRAIVTDVYSSTLTIEDGV